MKFSLFQFIFPYICFLISIAFSSSFISTNSILSSSFCLFRNLFVSLFSFFPKKGKNFLLFWFICVVFFFLLSIVTFFVSFYLPPSLLTLDITLHSLFDLQPEHYNGTLQNKLTLHKSIKHPPTTSQMALNSNTALWNDFLYLFRGRWKTADN